MDASIAAQWQVFNIIVMLYYDLLCRSYASGIVRATDRRTPLRCALFRTPPPSLTSQMCYDDQGNMYYYNHATEASQWERPADMAVAGE
jgi:hypothetical protein